MPGSPRWTFASAVKAAGGVYHSVSDDFYWFTHFADPNFIYGRALAQTVGTAVMRLADADLLPFEFTDQAETIRRYVNEVKTLLTEKQNETRERNREIDDGIFTATSDPEKPVVPPSKEPTPPFLNFAPLENGSASLDRAAERYDKALGAAQQNRGAAIVNTNLQSLNQKLMMTERAFLSEQ